MKQIIIACSMMEDELNKVMKETNCSIPVIWIERGYHNTPDKLKDKLQLTIDSLSDYEEILLTFGLCGNGTEGIVSRNSTLIMPRFDDCINMLLCDGKRTARSVVETGAIYLTRGWTMDRDAILEQYEITVEKYGEEMAREILDMMYEHYEKITVLDTRSYDLKPVMQYAQKAAGLLELSTERAEGSTTILKQLILGEWNENFIVQKPGEAVKTGLFEAWN